MSGPYIVTTTADDGPGSLRQAVADANATAGGDTIEFAIPPASHNCIADACTITLSSILSVHASGGPLSIVNSSGAARLMISGDNQTRLIEVDNGGVLVLDGITFSHGSGSGSPGAVIYNFLGDLTVRNCVVSDNVGDGYAILSYAYLNGGNLSVENTSIRDNSLAGVYFTNGVTVGGIATISNSTISNNHSSAGGGNGGGV
jgi:hypothetical protein